MIWTTSAGALCLLKLRIHSIRAHLPRPPALAWQAQALPRAATPAPQPAARRDLLLARVFDTCVTCPLNWDRLVCMHSDGIWAPAHNYVRCIILGLDQRR